MREDFLGLPVDHTTGSEHIKKMGITHAAQFVIGAEAACIDQPCGTVSRVVIDPIAQAVTHFVVEPSHRHDMGRLVPLDLVDSSTGEVRLRCAVAGVDALDHAEESQFLPGSGGRGGYKAGQVLSQPFYGLGDVIGDVPRTVTYDTIPLNEVEVRRGQQVHATDGAIGKVEGLVIDTATHHVTHELLAEGHLWGRKDVAIAEVQPVPRTGATSQPKCDCGQTEENRPRSYRLDRPGQAAHRDRIRRERTPSSWGVGQSR
jgi:sporulation protein YlmC with PRC-barrel domain